MRCPNCGFVSTKDFHQCPYCGHRVKSAETNVLRKQIKLLNILPIDVKTAIELIMVNLFGAGILVDWYLEFAYGITFWTYLVTFLVITLVEIFSRRKRTAISALERLDLYLIGALLLGALLCKIPGTSDIRAYFIAFAIPFYTLVIDLILTMFIFNKSHSKLRPLFTDFLILFHLGIISLIFIFFMVNKYTMINLNEKENFFSPFKYFNLDAVEGNKFNPTAPMFMIEQILIYISFGVTLLFFVNYNIIIFSNVFRQARGAYGKKAGN